MNWTWTSAEGWQSTNWAATGWPKISPPVAKPFRFLDLPAEIRLLIYKFVVESISIYEIYPCCPVNDLPAILLANKQINREANLVFYENATFMTDYWWFSWIDGLPPKCRNKIKRIRIEPWLGSRTMKPRSYSPDKVQQEIDEIKRCGESSGIHIEPGVLWVRARDEDGDRWTNEFGKQENFEKCK